MSQSPEEIIRDRASTHGKFITGADLSQRLKATMRSAHQWSSLPPDMREALEMVALKAGRILNGDPSEVEHWLDLAGYPTLVAKRLQGEAL